MGSVAKSYMRKDFLIYEEMRKYLFIYDEAVSHVWLCSRSLRNFFIYEEHFLFFFISVVPHLGGLINGLASQDSLQRSSDTENFFRKNVYEIPSILPSLKGQHHATKSTRKELLRGPTALLYYGSVKEAHSRRSVNSYSSWRPAVGLLFISDTSLIKDQEIIIAVFLQFLANLSKEVVMGTNGLNDIMLYHKI